MKEAIKKIMPKIILNRFRAYKHNKASREKLQMHEGNDVCCSICNSTYKEFGEFGFVKRKNALCHTCGSLERHRLLWKFLKEKTNLLNSKAKLRLLHFAPEKVFYDLFSEHKNIEYYPCDLMPENYTHGGKIEVLKADITDIPFENNYFDVILCNHVLEHIPNDELAISELFRVMKQDAWAILQVPIDYNREETYEDFSITDPNEKMKVFGHYDHVRWYGRDYKNRLEKSGLKVNEDDFVKSFTKEEIFKFGLKESEYIYYCEK